MTSQESSRPDSLPGPASQVWTHQTGILLILSSAGIFLLDLVTRPSVDVPILYTFVVLLCLRCSRPHASLFVAGAAIPLTAIPPVFLWTAALEWSIILNRVMTAGALG